MDSSASARTRKLQKPRRAGNGGAVAGGGKASWCCSFNSPPKSPESLSVSKTPHLPRKFPNSSETLAKSLATNSNNSFPNSPASSKSGLSIVGRMDPRRILSPGRVSPIDSDPCADSYHVLSPEPAPIGNVGSAPAIPTALDPSQRLNLSRVTAGVEATASSHRSGVVGGVAGGGRAFDVRLNLKGKRGACLALELSSDVLSRNSSVFAGLISDHCRNNLNSGVGVSGLPNLCRIEVPDVENLGVFRDTIELMFEDDITRRLLKAGPYRAIDILEVSANIKFSRGVSSCLKYLEAVPWSEEEEEKLRKIFTKFKFDDNTSKEILARLNLIYDSATNQQNLASELVWSITSCANSKARNELKSMVKGLLCKSSVYDKDEQDIKKEELYDVSRSCLTTLTGLLEEVTCTAFDDQGGKKNCKDNKPLVESISWQVDNINWLLEILLDRQMAEEFVDIWADQEELHEMHGNASPMIRYELSRVSAALFIAMGTRKLQCLSKSRSKLFEMWFDIMLLDFGWLQRCKKGLDMKELEEAMGQALLTLPLKQQYSLFMKWFKHFSKHGNESPNLSKAFQIWWRRTFLRGSETHSIESRLAFEQYRQKGKSYRDGAKTQPLSVTCSNEKLVSRKIN